jgi:O-antigen/teichoic acid export membrane protein
MLLLPTGLVTAAVLARALGPANYGLFSLTASFIGWLGLTLNAFLSRATVKLVSETEQWQSVATSLLRWRVTIGAVATAAVIAGAGVIAKFFGEPALAPYLRVFAFDLLLLNVARTYRDVLTGTGQFRAVALQSAVRWSARMILLVTLVWFTHSTMAAVGGSVGATLMELLIGSRLQPLALRGPSGITLSQLWQTAGPLLIFSAAMQLQLKVDLFALAALGGSTANAGFYSAAQNLAVPPSLFTLAFSPMLLATLSRLERTGQTLEASAIARSSLRLCLAFIPLAAIVAGTSGQVVHLVFGAAFASAAPLLALLFAATVALSTTAVCVAIVTAAAQSARVSSNVSVLGVLLVGSAIVGHGLLIPRLGALGAAMATAVSAALSACAGLVMVHRRYQLQAYASAIRAIVAAAVVYGAAIVIPAASWWLVVLKLALLTAAALSILLLLGELEPDDRKRLRALLRPAAV